MYPNYKKTLKTLTKKYSIINCSYNIFYINLYLSRQQSYSCKNLNPKIKISIVFIIILFAIFFLLFQSYYFFKHESLDTYIYQSPNTRFIYDNSPLTSPQNFRQKENLRKIETSLTSFIFLSSLPIPASVINSPTMCEPVVSGRQCCATSIIKSIRGPVACSN